MKARPKEIKLRYLAKQKDFVAAWGGEGACKADANWVLGFLTLSKAETMKAVMELERRGYDLNTLRFSIRKKKNVPA